METATIIDNRTLVTEEHQGYGPLYLVQHQTHVSDPDVRDRIAEMSIQEIVS